MAISMQINCVCEDNNKSVKDRVISMPIQDDGGTLFKYLRSKQGVLNDIDNVKELELIMIIDSARDNFNYLGDDLILWTGTKKNSDKEITIGYSVNSIEDRASITIIKKTYQTFREKYKSKYDLYHLMNDGDFNKLTKIIKKDTTIYGILKGELKPSDGKYYLVLEREDLKRSTAEIDTSLTTVMIDSYKTLYKLPNSQLKQEPFLISTKQNNTNLRVAESIPELDVDPSFPAGDIPHVYQHLNPRRIMPILSAKDTLPNDHDTLNNTVYVRDGFPLNNTLFRSDTVVIIPKPNHPKIEQDSTGSSSSKYFLVGIPLLLLLIL